MPTAGERKEPGHADVVHRERGDPRQQKSPIEKQKGSTAGDTAQDRAPAGSPRDEKSPWLGGG